MNLALPIGGAGVAALENYLVGDNLPSELQKVNLGLGAATGAAMAMDPAHRGAYLASWPIKSMGLFGIGSMANYVNQQSELADKNLEIADINRRTAETSSDNAGNTTRNMLMFLLPALAAGGGLGYHAWNQYQKNKAQKENSRFRTKDEKGKLSGRQRIRIDVPVTAMPDEFMQSLMNADDIPRARSRLQEKHASLLGELTGVGPTLDVPREGGSALGSFAGQDYGNAMRYGLATAGQGMMGLTLLRGGMAPALAMMLRRPRLAAMMGKMPAGAMGSLRSKGPASLLRGGMRRNLTEAPAFAKWLWHWTEGNKLSPKSLAARRGANPTGKKMDMRGAVDRARDMRYRYRPDRYAFDSKNPFLRGPLMSWLRPSATPGTSLLSRGVEGAKFMANRAVNTAYRGKQLALRNPNMSLTAAGLPLSMVGLQRDKERDQDARSYLNQFSPNFREGRGFDNFPVSVMMGNALQNLYGGTNSFTQ